MQPLRKVKALENERLQAQLSAMTAQMNPHLLFNALNSIAALVQEDPARAEETIVKLSELYRGVLQSSQKMMHSLATELDLCESYLAIEKVRFGDRLRTRIEIASPLDTSDVQVPALSLQPLVENAVKHGIAPLAAGGTIVIAAASLEGQLILTVEDDGVGLGRTKSKGTGTGLANCRERMKLHFNDRGRVEIMERVGGGTRVLVSLPERGVIG